MRAGWAEPPLIGTWSARSTSPAAVRDGEDLQAVPVGVVPVEAATTVVGVDLVRPVVERVGPPLQSAVPDAGVDLVELLLRDQERVVLRPGLPVVIGHVERDVVADLDDQERA